MTKPLNKRFVISKRFISAILLLLICICVHDLSLPGAQSALAKNALSQVDEEPRYSWHGVVPGKSSLDFAIQKLGVPTEKIAKGSQLFCKFADGAVVIQVEGKSKIVSYITVNASIKDDPAFPRKKSTAIKMYQTQLGLFGLPNAQLAKVGSHIEGPTVECTFTSGKDPQLKQIRFKPLTIVESQTENSGSH